MKRLTVFLQRVLIDLGRWCCISTTDDYNTIVRRIEEEGISFLTITLPTYGRDFEQSLDQGFIAPGLFAGFKRRGGLPLLFGGFLEQIFDRGGRLVDEPSVTAIWAVRQITLMWAKMSLECSKERRDAAIRQYVETEREVRESETRLYTDSIELVESYRRIGILLWGNVLDSVSREIDAVPSRIIPKHGPGATADRITGNRKWDIGEWTDRLEQVFPAGEHLISSWRYYPEIASVRYLEPGAERPVRVVTVPKSLKTPRIIAIEPVCMQYVQQGLLASFRRGLQQDGLCWDLIGWGSQVPNQRLASQGARDGSRATLDLSEASDRVSNQHVRELLRNHSSVDRAVGACRSRKADVPGVGNKPVNQVLTLAKFASMGSALCFPMEAMVFCTIIFVAIEAESKRPLTRKAIEAFRHKVRVYGDDIIVPVRYVRAVIEHLEAFGLKVNSHKSFWTGKFRESCGKEYYAGDDVSIVRLRSLFPSSLRDGPEIISTISTRNQMYLLGMWETARYLDTVVEKVINLPLPRVSQRSPVLGRLSFLGPDLDGELHSSTHRPLVRGPVVKSVLPVSKLDGSGALLKCLTLLETAEPSSDQDEVFFLDRDDPWFPIIRELHWSASFWGAVKSSNPGELRTPDVRHLDRSGRPRSVNIKIVKGPST